MSGYRRRPSSAVLRRRPWAWLPRPRVEERRDDGPPEEAYGRVTDPERYAVLHDAAARLVDDLAATYDVTVEEGAHLADEDGWEPRRIVRLTPSDPRAATVTVTFTDFPGVHVRAGRWFETFAPGCGCDACDEDPADRADAIVAEVLAVVHGELAERQGGGLRPSRSMRLRYDGGQRSSTTRLSRAELRRSGGSGDVTWVPWSRRG